MKIVESMKDFLKEIAEKNSNKTVEKYDAVLDLFGDYLAGYGEVTYEENKDGRFILTADTKELEFGHANSFLDWFLIRKVLGPGWIIKAAPNIIKKYFKWLDGKGLLAEGVIEEVVYMAKQAAKDLPRVDKAADLLFKLCDLNSGKYMDKDFDDDDYMEGYGDVTGILEDNIYLDYEGEKIGPIQITKKIANLLKTGDTINLSIGRYRKKWYPLEVGNVYPG